MGHAWVHFYKGYQLARAWRSKMFFYGGERIPAHITNYKMAREFIDKYLEPKMIELKIYSKDFNMFTDEVACDFPFKSRPAMRNEIKKHWFYYKEDEQLDKIED